MATTIITISDKPDGTIDLRIEMNPPLKMQDGSPLIETPAQAMGADFLRMIREAVAAGDLSEVRNDTPAPAPATPGA